MIPLILAFIVPIFIGLFFGWRGFNDAPHTPMEFAMGAGWALVWAAGFIYAWHMVWLAALMMAEGPVNGLAGLAGYWALISGTIWLPVLMITYVIRAQKGVRQ